VITLPARDVPVIDEVDVLVAGGGTAGIAAAIAAARAGARTMLVERYGSLGGMATGGLVILLLTMDDGAGRQVVSGICQEFVDRMSARGAVYYPPRGEWNADDERLVEHYRRWGLVWGRGPHRVRYSVAFDPEEFRFAANTLIGETPTRLRLHTWVADVVTEDGAITAVVLQSKAGREAVRTRVVIDATGDGDVFAAAGLEHDRERVHPWLWFRMGNVADIDRAITDGRDRFFKTMGGYFFRTPGAGRTLMPWGIADVLDRKIDPTDPDELTFAEVECRRLVMEVADRIRAEVPSFRDAYLNDVAWQLGITESRRLRGAYVLTRADVGRSFEDSVALTGNWTKYGDVYAIPYRCLYSTSAPNLLATGRCISVDHPVHQATKEIPPAMATGQAAGVAASVAASGNGDVRSVDVGALRRLLQAQGAIIS
jgi:2-polyprenyl-6-methoxyphenol hydroxylase-like FAD-dependent oxidoreductase